MAHAIPKIHYKITNTDGDTTNGDPNIANVGDTGDIEVGQFCVGTGIPVGTTVLSKTATSVTLSANATATATDVELEFFTLLEFSYPPIEQSGEKLAAQERRSLSLSGTSQVSIDFIEGQRNLVFSFLSQSLYAEVKTFFETCAVFGDAFKYFDDKTLTDFIEYELRVFDFDPRKITSRGTNYVWSVQLQFRRVI